MQLETVMTRQEPADDTRERIIQAAGEIFAEEGFQSATVRSICEKAQVNVASVNYHFRDKIGLYTEVLRASMLQENLPPYSDTDNPEDALRLFIRTMVSRLLRHGSESWRMHIMAREMAQPTPALKTVVDQTIRPKAERLRGIIARITGLPHDDPRVRRSTFSVVGQCLMYRIGAPVLRELWPELVINDQQIEAIATHIANFSLNGIHGLIQSREKI